MRVIAGKFRSRPLVSAAGHNLRPTSDRLRETLFDVLTAGNPSALEGTAWIDLYAGTGAVGIEAISRGAEMFISWTLRLKPLTDSPQFAIAGSQFRFQGLRYGSGSGLA